jgi:hypothetical protein
VNHYKASVKSVTPLGDLPLFLVYEMPETYLNTIFLLMKEYPELVCCIPVVSIAKKMFEDLLSDSNALSRQAMLLEKALEESNNPKPRMQSSRANRLTVQRGPAGLRSL